MEKQESSISIINRSGGTVTGENTGALPIKLINNLQALKPFFAGFFTAIFVVFVLIFVAKQQIVLDQSYQTTQTNSN